jgi:hypothetical protein
MRQDRRSLSDKRYTWFFLQQNRTQQGMEGMIVSLDRNDQFRRTYKKSPRLGSMNLMYRELQWHCLWGKRSPRDRLCTTRFHLDYRFLKGTHEDFRQEQCIHTQPSISNIRFGYNQSIGPLDRPEEYQTAKDNMTLRDTGCTPDLTHAESRIQMHMKLPLD